MGHLALSVRQRYSYFTSPVILRWELDLTLRTSCELVNKACHFYVHIHDTAVDVSTTRHCQHTATSFAAHSFERSWHIINLEYAFFETTQFGLAARTASTEIIFKELPPQISGLVVFSVWTLHTLSSGLSLTLSFRNYCWPKISCIDYLLRNFLLFFYS